MTPVMGALIGIVTTLIIVAIVIVFIVRTRDREDASGTQLVTSNQHGQADTSDSKTETSIDTKSVTVQGDELGPSVSNKTGIHGSLMKFVIMQRECCKYMVLKSRNGDKECRCEYYHRTRRSSIYFSWNTLCFISSLWSAHGNHSSMYPSNVDLVLNKADLIVFFSWQSEHEVILGHVARPLLRESTIRRKDPSTSHDCTYTVSSMCKDVILSPRHKLGTPAIEEELNTVTIPLITSTLLRNPRESAV